MANTYVWKPTSTRSVIRHDDIWFVSAQEGWAVNSDGKIIYTQNEGDKWVTVASDAQAVFRCMGMTPSGQGWVGALVPREKRLWHSKNGQDWAPFDDKLLPSHPSSICGICVVGEDVIYASGTQYPARPAAVMKSTNGGDSWSFVDMGAHADLLIDIYFIDEQNGWVVGGKGGDRYEDLKPVVLRTDNGGATWTNKLKDSGIKFPLGEWGWKIQFLDDQLGFISTENFNAAAILKTLDGGETWERIVVDDPRGNKNLEGIGFLNEQIGWVGGWGGPFPRPPGYSSGTVNGGDAWFDANNIGLYINRFRLTGETPIVAYASGEHVYRCEEVSEEESGLLLASDAAGEASTEKFCEIVSERLDIRVEVPKAANHLRVVCFDRRLRLAHVFCDEQNPAPGDREFSWNFETPSGEDIGLGYFTYRIDIDDETTSNLIARVSRVAPAELGARVADMIAVYAPFARRAHGDLTLPDAVGQPVSLRGLFNKPVELMAALVRGGWVVPYFPKRSMFLVSIIGTGSNSGPMQNAMHEDDVQLLNDWIAAGAILPNDEHIV